MLVHFKGQFDYFSVVLLCFVFDVSLKMVTMF